MDVIHPGQAPASKESLAKELAKMYKTDASRVFLFGFRTKFGGGKSSGFGLIYDNISSPHRLGAPLHTMSSACCTVSRASLMINGPALQSRL